MIAHYLSALTSLAPALGNHLWQSTLFAATAGLLTLPLRQNQARVRYWLWLAASIKFLIPFSPLIGIGHHLAWKHAAVTTNTGFYSAMEQATQPFTPPATPVIAPIAPTPVSITLLHLLPALLLAAWFCGFITVMLVWCLRWRRISASLRQAIPLREGREVNALRRMERAAGIRQSIALLLSKTSLEPGIFGIVHPVLVWPHGISERLEDAHLEAILAHELCHVSRRDNLDAVLHMVVEALFWFHPLVWWLGAQLLQERERACDEQVLQMGNERQVYAESILKICEFCVGSPLACVSGVTGADLKKRIANIMTNSIAKQLDFSKKLLLGAAATLAVLVPVVLGAAFTSPSATAQTGATNTDGTKNDTFQSASIQASQPGSEGIMILLNPDGFRVQNFSLRKLIAFAYNVQDTLITGPDVLNAKYNIYAKPGVVGNGYGGVDTMRARVRQLLADRFQLTVHHNTQPLTAYVLTVGGSGHMQVAPPNEPGPVMNVRETSITVKAFHLDDFIELLSEQLGQPVLDKTGLTKTYDITLDWKSSNPNEPEDKTKAVLNALQAQLGLTAQLQQTSTDFLIVDSAQSPTGLIAARKPIPMDSKVFDMYVGYYSFLGHRTMHVYRDNDHFLTQLSGQQPVEIFPEAQREFFATVVDAQISFEVNAQGHTSGLVLHQNGHDISAPHIDDATAQQWAEALKTKVQQQVATPGSEQALRRLLQQLANGKPDYSQMSPELAQATREQLPALQSGAKELGTLISLKFTGVGPMGADIYSATFEHGATEWRVSLSADGKIEMANFRRVN